MLDLVEVALAGLLYDTGKRLQRGSGGFDERDLSASLFVGLAARLRY